jgi:hypothetical protein
MFSRVDVPVDRSHRFDAPTVVDKHATMFGQHLASAAGAEQQRRLAQRLRLERAAGQRGDGDQPSPRGGASARVEEMMCVAAVGPAPDPPVQSRRATPPRAMRRKPIECRPNGCSTVISYGSIWAPTPPTLMSPPQSITTRV